MHLLIIKLKDHPWVGMLSSGIGAAAGAAYSFMTNEATLRLVAALSAYCGLAIGALTLYIRLKESRKLLKNKP